jgi:acetyl esterase/lipase
MELDKVAPELRARVRWMPRFSLRRRWVLRLLRALTSRMRAVPVPGVRLETADGVRVYRPEVVRSDAALLWIHGGGLVGGSAVADDRFCGETARELGITVVSAEYRLAPENPCPAAIDDCHAAWTWLRERAGSLGVDPARVAVGGQSAGGGLAAALVQQLHDEGGSQPLAQWLFCPMLDDRTAARRDLDRVGHLVWNNRLNHFGWRAYLAAEPGVSEVPRYAVPARRGDLSGLPPAWIGVGDIDLFHDEDRAYAEQLRADGVETQFEVVPGGPHGFEAWGRDTEVGRTYLAAARTWLRART